MATPEDNHMCDQMFKLWAEELPECRSIVMLSPSDYELRRLRVLYPAAKLMVFSKRTWDLNHRWTGNPVDLITACNVFHYSTNPGLWFKNVLDACQQFWIQDLIVRPRGEPQLGADGDQCRFCWGGYLGVTPSWPTFDLKILGDRVKEFEAYDAGSYRARAILINFVARIEGAVN